MVIAVIVPLQQPALVVALAVGERGDGLGGEDAVGRRLAREVVDDRDFEVVGRGLGEALDRRGRGPGRGEARDGDGAERVGAGGGAVADRAGGGLLVRFQRRRS